MTDSPENSLNPARTSEAKAYHERRVQKKAAAPASEEWFQLEEGGKVVKKTRTPKGHVHSVYIGTKKQADAKGIKYRK